MSKEIHAGELLKMLEKKTIKPGTRIKLTNKNYSSTMIAKVLDNPYKNILQNEDNESALAANWLIGTKIELIEEDTIDIESIEKIENEVMRDDWRYYVPLFFNKINEIVPAVKQLNRELKELKEDKKCDRKPNVQ